MAGLSKLVIETDKPAITQDITNFIIQSQKEGISDQTTIDRVRALKQLSHMTDLRNTDQTITTIINNERWNKLTRKRYASIYKAYLTRQGIDIKLPRIRTETRIPFIPTEAEIDQLIAGCGKRTATLLQTLKETAARISEAFKLKWTDLDIQQRTLNITPAKGSNPRLLPITNKLINMLSQLPHDRETIFPKNIHISRQIFSEQRNKLAKKLSNPRIQRITFHTLRHWKATMEYHHTKDIVHVKTMLGHKAISNTMIYINIEQALFLQSDENFTCKVAHNEKEEIELIEAGFEHVKDREQLSFYRRRK